MSPLKKKLLTFALGAVVGTLGDQIHVRFGVLKYRTPHPKMYGQAYWVPLLMGAAAVAMVEGYRTVRERASGEEPQGTVRDVAREAAWFYLLYLASGVLCKYPKALAAAFTGFFVTRVVRDGDDVHSVFHAVSTALMGSAFEHWLTGTGAFGYEKEHHHVGRVSWWLPGLYLQAARFARALARCFPREVAQAMAPA